MQFIHQPLIWGFLLVLVPLLIHLINMMRHRRVKWAAMEFLLASYRKHRRWIWLKQWLLLLLRMALVAAVVAMLAKLVTRDQFGGLFGQPTTHHVVLLDDSLSMSDREQGKSAFERAKEAIIRITERAAANETGNRLTLIRYSAASRTDTVDQTDLEQLTEIQSAPINHDFPAQLAERLQALQPTQLAVTGETALEVASRLVEETSDERFVLYVVSDFRNAEWDQPAALLERLSRLSQQKVPLHLVRCVDQSHSNLAVVDLSLPEGTHAAGVPLFANLKVKNFGETAADQVVVKVEATQYEKVTGDLAEQTTQLNLPDVLFERIGPGEIASRQFQLYFPIAGEHVIHATLPSDAIDSDNQAWRVLRLPPGESALIVDSDPNAQAAFYLDAIFRPGGTARTGILPDVQPLTYLRDATPDELARHAAIYLIDPPRLETRIEDNLRQYVEQGGGLAIFVGPESNPRFLTEWYADGQGLFPAPIVGSADQPLEDEQVPDVEFGEHSIFRILQGQGNPFANAVRVSTYLATPNDWTPPTDSGIEILATVRDGHPLVVRRSFGDGRVVAWLTTIDPKWNNWARQPSLIVVVLQLHAHLAQPMNADSLKQVGSRLELQVDSAAYRPELLFRTPTFDGTTAREIQVTARPVASDHPTLLTAQLGQDLQTGRRSGDTDVSGIYDAELLAIDGSRAHRRFALNIDPVESDLSINDTVSLRERLGRLDVEITSAEQISYEYEQASQGTWSQLLLVLLILGLLCEQWLAYSASYHPPKRASLGGSA